MEIVKSNKPTRKELLGIKKPLNVKLSAQDLALIKSRAYTGESIEEAAQRLFESGAEQAQEAK